MQGAAAHRLTQVPDRALFVGEGHGRKPLAGAGRLRHVLGDDAGRDVNGERLGGGRGRGRGRQDALEGQRLRSHVRPEAGRHQNLTESTQKVRVCLCGVHSLHVLTNNAHCISKAFFFNSMCIHSIL